MQKSRTAQQKPDKKQQSRSKVTSDKKGSSRSKALVTRHPVIRVYTLQGSTFIGTTYYFDITKATFEADTSALAVKELDEVVEGQASKALEIAEVRRIVFFETGTLSGDEKPLLVADISPGAKLQLKSKRKEISLDAKVLCALDSVNQIAFEWSIKVEKKAGQSKPVHQSFKIRENLLGKVKGDPADKLAELLKLPQSEIPVLDHNAFKSDLLKEATALDVPRWKPPDCTVSGKRQETIVSFPKLSEFFGPTEKDFHVIAFELKTADLMTCNDDDRGKVRTFWGGDENRFEYLKAEAPKDWRFVQRPSKKISTSMPDASLRRGASWILHVIGVPTRPTARSWNRLVDRFHLFLTGTQGSRSVSFLPLFENYEAERWTAPESVGHWLMSYELIDGPRERFVFLDGETEDQTDRIAIRPLSLHFINRLDSGTAPVLNGSLPQVFTVTGTPLAQGKFALTPLTGDKAALGSAEIKEEGIFLNLSDAVLVTAPTAQEGESQATTVVRMGALDLVFGPSQATLANENNLRLAPLQRIVLVQTKFYFAIQNLGPGGQDYSASEEFVSSTDGDGCFADRIRPKPPIIVPLKPPPAPAAATKKLLLLVQQEYKIKAEPPHVLSLDIYSQEPKTNVITNVCAQAERTVVVLDRNPFLVAQVRYPDFDRLSSFAGSKIATWTSSGASSKWELLFEEKPFCLVLPPQAVGEEMLKADKNEQPVGDGSLPFNLGPPTTMEVDARQVRTNFAEAPWNLRRIFGTRGEPLAGLLVKQLHYELLYGLTGDAENPGIRLADVFSQAGRIAALSEPLTSWLATDPQLLAYKTSRVEWSKVYARYLARAGVLVPWNSILLDPDQPPVVLSESLSCRLRLPPDSNMKAPLEIDPPPPDVGTLRGGATWGFESKNIYKAVLDNQPSSSARLENFSFSALGGWGQQQANFQNDLSRISADVAMGRTYRYKVERLGRIACTWHRARHVIIYERSVVPQSQYPEIGEDLKGWPILRKVKEYVELVDAKRIFPDDEEIKDKEAVKRARGFITDCTFQQGEGTRFNVHSSWGSDVRDIGWKIPIWRRGAQPAHLYPEPDVSFGTATNLSNEQGSHNCDCDNPDNFYFFTLTKDPITGGNPDRDPRKWPPILGVDFVNAPRPRPKTGDFADGDPRATSPADSAVPPMYGPCTFRLKPAAVPADVVAERAGKAMAAVIQTITISRSVEPDSEKVWGAAAATVAELEDGLARTYSAMLKSLPLNAVPTAADIAALANKINSDFAGYATKLENAKKVFDNPAAGTGLIRDLEEKLKIAENAIFTRLKSSLTKVTTEALNELDANIKVLIASGGFTVDKAKRLLLEHQHQIEEVFLLVNSLPGVVPEMLARYVDLLVGLARGLDDSLTAAEQTLNATQESIDRARTELATALQSARALIESFEGLGLTRPLPFLPDPIAAVKTELEIYVNAFKSFDETAKKLLDDLRAATDLAAARKAIKDFRDSSFFVTLKDKTKLRDFITKAFGKTINVDDPLQLREAIHFARKWRDDALNTWRTTAKRAVESITNQATLLQAQVTLRDWLSSGSVVGGLERQLTTLQTEINSRVAKAAAIVLQSILNTINGLQFTDIQRNIRDALRLGADKIEAELKRQRDLLTEQTRRYFEHATGLFQDSNLPQAGEIFQQADRTLRLLRAFGEPPRVPKLEFDRPQIAYFFNDKIPNVDLTPVAAFVSQAASIAEKLKPLGVRLPTRQTLEQFLPVDLKNFDLTRVFPNFAGLDLSNLFSGIKLDRVGSDNVKITHGLDQQTRRAFVRADVKFLLDKEATIFTIGPMSLRILSADFEATSIVEAGVDGSVTRKVYGRITGDWQLVMSGMALLKFKKTELKFDDASGIRFAINPRNIEMPQLLAFLSDLVNITGGDGKQGFSIGLLPNGVRAMLNLPLPDMQAGAFGISNLRLSAIMALEFGEEFAISIGFALARREAPFSLTIFFLGGGGFFEVMSTYLTKSRRLMCRVDMGITVSASLAIALGPIKGGVYVYLGLTATYQNDRGLAIGVMVLLRGEVNVLGIISASLTLLLEAIYDTQSKSITGRGRLSIKIKICWCFTLEVNAEVSYTLGTSSGRAMALPAHNNEARPAYASRQITDESRRLSAHASSLTPLTFDIYDTIAESYINLLV